MASFGWPMMWPRYSASVSSRPRSSRIERRRRGADGRCRRGCRRGRRAALFSVMPAPAGPGGRGGGVVGGGGDAAEREEMHALDRRSRVRRPVGGELGEELGRLERDHKPGEVSRGAAAPGGSGRRRRPSRTSAASGAWRAGDADWTGRVMPAARSARPRRSTGAASKQNWVAIAIWASVSRAKPALRASAAMALASPPAGSMSLLPSGWPATCRRVKPRASKTPVSSSASPRRRGRAAGDAAGDHQRLADAHVGVGGDAGVKLGEAGDAAGRDVRHHREAFVGEAAGGGEHLGELGAVDMREIDPGARGQDGAEVLDLRRGARHHLDREILRAARASRRRRAGRGRSGLRRKLRFAPSGRSAGAGSRGRPSRRWRSGP